MNLSKIHHIAIIVSDYEAAKDFYVNKLGFSVIRENYRSERKDWKLDLRVNEYTELEIFAEENPPKRVNRPEACGLRHLAFCVDSVEQTMNELVEVGIECTPEYSGVRPHKEKINISKEIINKTRGAEAPYAARMNHTPLRGEQQATVL